MTTLATRRHTRRTRLELTGYLATLGAGVYVVATAAGSVLDPSYSQIRQHVSDLTATGSTTWAPLAPWYLVYNLLVAGFAIELYRVSNRGRLWQVGTGLLLANTFAGVMMVTLFREDLGGTPVTPGGTGHLVFAGVSSLAILIAAFSYGISFRRSSAWRSLAPFSVAVGVAFAILGPLAAYATAQRSELAGLAERGPIGLFIVWLCVVGGYSVVAGHHIRR